jgi:hypothetical protein
VLVLGFIEQFLDGISFDDSQSAGNGFDWMPWSRIFTCARIGSVKIPCKCHEDRGLADVRFMACQDAFQNPVRESLMSQCRKFLSDLFQKPVTGIPIRAFVGWLGVICGLVEWVCFHAIGCSDCWMLGRESATHPDLPVDMESVRQPVL